MVPLVLRFMRSRFSVVPVSERASTLTFPRVVVLVRPFSTLMLLRSVPRDDAAVPVAPSRLIPAVTLLNTVFETITASVEFRTSMPWSPLP
jgi:hypothetical protein